MKITPQVAEALNSFLSEYSIYINYFLGITILFCILCFILSLVKLGGVGLGFGNMAQERKVNAAMKSLLVSGVSLIVLGGISAIYYIFLNAIVL